MIMKIFDPDSPLMSALGKLADLFFCNMLFVVFSLPIITMGASLSALHCCAVSLVNDTEESFIPLQFWKAFRKNFKRSTLAWLICLGIFLLLGAYYLAVSMLTPSLQKTYRITFYVLVFLFLCGFQYIFPLIAQFPLKVSQVLKNAWLLSAAELPWTLLTIAVEAAAIYLSFFMNPDAYGISLFLWAVEIPALIAYLNSFFFRIAFRRMKK
ncbi:MAG: YesL family protein [Oscillospiraceae bacterium]|nr:YesL family protein [Oscillospiraceae bacterium]